MTYPRRLGVAATGNLIIPVNGGSATASIAAADFGLTTLEYVVDVRIESHGPVIDNVFEPSYGISANAVGITVAAGAGTTLTCEVIVLGY